MTHKCRLSNGNKRSTTSFLTKKGVGGPPRERGPPPPAAARRRVVFFIIFGLVALGKSRFLRRVVDAVTTMYDTIGAMTLASEEQQQ